MIKLKTEEEIELLREGGRRLAEILHTLKKEAQPGVSTAHLNDLAIHLVEEGGDTPAFLDYTPEGAARPYPSALCTSINEEIVHGVSNEDPAILESGMMLSLDMGLVHKGMFLDSAITIIVGGGPDASSNRLIDATREALTLGIEAAKVGAHIGDIGVAIEEVANRYGYGVAEGLAGHGVGYGVHEEPYVPNIGVLGDGPVIEEGLVIAIEPMFTEGGDEITLAPDGFTYTTADNTRSAHFEHTIAVTKRGPEVMTVLK